MRTHNTVSTSIFYCIVYCMKDVRNQKQLSKTIILSVHANMLMLVSWAVSHYHYAYYMKSKSRTLIGYLMELSCPLGIQALSCTENLSCFGVLSHIINPLLTKLVRSRWPRSFFVCLWTSTSSQSINMQERTCPISSYLDLTLGK